MEIPIQNSKLSILRLNPNVIANRIAKSNNYALHKKYGHFLGFKMLAFVGQQ